MNKKVFVALACHLLKSRPDVSEVLTDLGLKASEAIASIPQERNMKHVERIASAFAGFQL